MKLKLHTISPVHIGTGKSLEPFEYILEDNVFYRLDQNKAFKLALQKHPDFPEKLDKWIADRTERLRKAKDNQEQSKIRSRFNFKYFCESVLRDASLATEILERAYSYKCEAPVGLQNKKHVNELLKDANNNLFIPGTSIKGAIRTILMWRAFKLLNDDEKRTILTKTVNSKAFIRRDGRFLDDILCEKIFNCGFYNQKNKLSFHDIKFDIMKFIHVSDAKPINATMAVLPINLYLLDEIPQTQTPAVEVIDFNSSFSFDISVNENEIREVYEKSLTRNSKLWIGFDKNFKNLFGFYPHEIPNGELEKEIVKSIKVSIDDFFKSLLYRERKWLNNYREVIKTPKGNKENANIEDVIEFYDAYEEISTMFKIGWASGFSSTTIYDILASDENTKPFLEKIFERFKIGVPHKKKELPNLSLPNFNKFPKSRRLVFEDGYHPVDPLGWVALLDFEQRLELE